MNNKKNEYPSMVAQLVDAKVYRFYQWENDVIVPNTLYEKISNETKDAYKKELLKFLKFRYDAYQSYAPSSVAMAKSLIKEIEQYIHEQHNKES